MIPNTPILTEEIKEENYPTNTYKVLVDMNRINGYTDELKALIQTIYFILNTERYQYPIYSWDYGVELVDLIGKPMPYVMSELGRRIKEALTQDDRILKVNNFQFTKNKKKLHVTFDVISIYGTIPTEKEVDI